MGDHVKSLRDTLLILRKNNFSANPAKCELALAEIEFLGFRISKDAIKMSKRKIKAIEMIQTSSNKKQLRRILGLFYFWRTHIKNHAQNTFHMRRLLTKNTEFKWTAECERELNYLKGALMKDPILMPIGPNKDFVIMCDASETGIGYTLLQYDDNNVLRVVSYGAHSLTPAQKNYVIAELELLAVGLALKQFECYAIHKNITIITDNTRVLHLDKSNAVNARQKRLLTYIMQFKITVKFIKGCHNYTADALSRVFEDATDVQKFEARPDQDADDFVLALEKAAEWINNRNKQMLTKKNDKVDGSMHSLDVIDDDEIESQDNVTKVNTIQSDIESYDKECDGLLQLPPLQMADYLADEEFQDVYRYLNDDELTGNDKKDKIILLTADQYFITNNALYKISTPRSKKEQVETVKH